MTSAYRLAAAIGVSVVLAWLLACGTEQPPGSHGNGDSLFPRLPKVIGHIDLVHADPDNPRHFRVLHITDAAGRQWQFSSEGWVGVSAGHLKDHQIQGTPVTVWYEVKPGGVGVVRFVGD